MDEHYSTRLPAEFSQEVAYTLQQLQRGLLKDGYEYKAGDEAHWPLLPVVMEKDGRLLLIAPWSADGQETVRNHWLDWYVRHKSYAGLLVVGSAAVDDPRVTEFLGITPGYIAYVDARTGRTKIRGWRFLTTSAPNAVRQRHLERLLLADEKDLAGIDGLSVLREQVTANRTIESFQETVTDTTGVRMPVITYLFVAICVIVFTGMLIHEWRQEEKGQSVALAWGALHGPLVREGQWWRLFSHSLLHGGLSHLGFNMLAMAIFGGMLERWQGRGRLLLVFLFSVFSGALAALWWTPHAVMVGASGGLFGLLGMIIAILLRHGKDFPTAMRDDLARWLRNLLFINLCISFLPGISLAAHAGGLAGGLLLGLIIARSPVKSAPITAQHLLALAALLITAVAAAQYLIARLPAG